MIKRTLYFGNPAYLRTSNEQMVVEMHDSGEVKNISIEDLALVILDHQQITVSQGLLAKLMANNVALVTCDHTHHPAGILLTLDGHTLQTQRHQSQVDSSLPLKKQLWQQTVEAKITNQANHLKLQRQEVQYMLKLTKEVKSGDPDNTEAKAASYYWKRVFPDFLNFSRNRDGAPPNNLLNYGYAILRALVARSLVGSGLIPSLGIHHRNQYNSFCLADDIMEPYRPFVDHVVCDIIRMNGKFLDMTPSMKKSLLSIPALDVIMDGEKSPLMNAVQRTTASLTRCFDGKAKKILYPVMKPE
jgi:CRISPR-associated protein Cas1